MTNPEPDGNDAGPARSGTNRGAEHGKSPRPVIRADPFDRPIRHRRRRPAPDPPSPPGMPSMATAVIPLSRGPSHHGCRPRTRARPGNRSGKSGETKPMGSWVEFVGCPVLISAARSFAPGDETKPMGEWGRFAGSAGGRCGGRGVGRGGETKPCPSGWGGETKPRRPGRGPRNKATGTRARRRNEAIRTARTAPEPWRIGRNEQPNPPGMAIDG